MKKYSTLNNIYFVHKYILQNSVLKYALCSGLIVLFRIVSTFLLTLLPTFIINILAENRGYQYFFSRLIIYFILMYSITILGERIKLKIDNELSFTRMFKGLDYYEHIMKTKYENIDTEKGKSIINAGISSYFDGYHEGFQHIILDFRTVLESVLGLSVFCVLFAYQINIILPFVLIALSACTMFINSLNSRWVYNHREKWANTDAKLRYISAQTISSKNAKDIRMYNMKDWLKDTYDFNVDFRMSWLKTELKLRQFVSISERVLTAIKYIAIFITLFNAIEIGTNAGTFVLALGLMMGMNKWTQQIFDNIKCLQSNNILVNNTRRVLDMDKDIMTNSKEQKIPLHKELRLQNITFSFPNEDKKLFDNFNLTIKKGEKLAIVGMNGAGKTTLMKLICGLYTPTAGSIYLDDIDIRQYSNRDYLAIFSAVFQDFSIFALSIKENVACCVADKIDVKKVQLCLLEAGIINKIEQLKNGVDTIMLKELDDEGAMLSGGEIQRLVLARCLYKDSQIIILDEPTASLDALAENELYAKYASLVRDKTSIFVSHRLSSTKFCDRIILLDNGNIIEDGTHEELITKNGKYAELYKLQSSYYNGSE